MKTNSSTALRAALALLSMALPTVGGENVPFKGIGFTVSTYAGPGPADCGYFRLTNEGSGELSHLGLFSVTLDACFRPDGYTVTVTLTAANGDQLFLDETIVDGSETHATDWFVITGGTGRFAGATGSGLHDISYDAPSELNIFDGTINFKKN